jgi:non-heme chloroperoxidase
MATITTKDGTTIYYKDWGKGQPIVFSHGWPLSADDWDGQMLYFGQLGYRVFSGVTNKLRHRRSRPDDGATGQTAHAPSKETVGNQMF